ncbi:helix-turn-helix domain-containing protein [Dactylosporangium sp. CA-139066]|uniref:helix-turn-helix domain-containing protein n=1 Tax=Dactylosporangium sp. CA-139066 TaxID=3239930 RepID=UPI003D8C8921
MTSSPASPTARRLRLGMELQRLREAAGVDRNEAAKAIDTSYSTISRIETGKTGIRLSDLRALLDLYGVTDQGYRQGLEELSREGRQQGWWSRHASILNRAYSTYIGLEQAATRLLAYESSVIHGLLQTEDYALDLLRQAKEPEDVTRQRVKVRMERQKRLIPGDDDTPAVRLWAILDESAILRQVGGPDVMIAQLKRLIEAASAQNVTLQVLPFEAGAHPAVNGPFSVIEMPEEYGTLVYIEGLAGDIYVEGTDVVRYTLAFDELRAAALAPNASVERIERAIAALQARRS